MDFHSELFSCAVTSERFSRFASPPASANNALGQPQNHNVSITPCFGSQKLRRLGRITNEWTQHPAHPNPNAGVNQNPQTSHPVILNFPLNQRVIKINVGPSPSSRTVDDKPVPLPQQSERAHARVVNHALCDDQNT